MKIILLTLTALLVSFSYSQSSQSPDFYCTMNGDLCEIRNSRGDIQMSGQLSNSKMNGVWTVWDSQGAKNAEMTLAEGVLDGKTTLYFGSFYRAEFAGKLKAEMTFANGKMNGTNRYYKPEGKLRIEFTTAGGTVQAKGKLAKNAEKEIANDLRYFDAILSIANEEIREYNQSLDTAQKSGPQ